MPRFADAQVVGVKAAVENLRAMGLEVSTTAARRGLYAGAVVFRDGARARVPVRTGALRKAIVAQTRGVLRYGGRAREYVGVVTIARRAYTRGARGGARGVKKREDGRAYVRGQIYPRNYAHLVEFGTAHSRPKPFMRPARDALQSRALAAVQARMLAEIRRAAARQAARARRAL